MQLLYLLAMGKMRKVKCGMETAERRLLVHRSDHVSAGITQFTAHRGKLRNGDVESSVLCMLP